MAAAHKKGLAAIAICDHDCVDGIGPCQELAAPLGVEVIPGVELTVEKKDAEIHILGYCVDPKNEEFRKKMKILQDARVERIHKMVEKLVAEGIPVKADEIFKLAGKGTVGRLHVARAVLQTGKIKNFKEIFEKYIGFLKPCYVSNIRFTPTEAMEAIRKAGGIPVLAHPQTMGNDEYIPELIECGLRGIEVYHTDHKKSVAEHYKEIAERYNLLITGGSDCHGMGKGRVLIGTVRVPYELVEKLKEASANMNHL